MTLDCNQWDESRYHRCEDLFRCFPSSKVRYLSLKLDVAVFKINVQLAVQDQTHSNFSWLSDNLLILKLHNINRRNGFSVLLN
jgi:hypothetical protein